MGKRELLLIIGFVFCGVIVYQATAPASDHNSRGVSLSSLIDNVRREIAGNRANAEITSSQAIPVNAAITELRIEALVRGQLSIVGEDREDIACELQVWSNGYDEAEARQLAEATRLMTNDAAASLVIQLEYPRPGHQRATLALKVPSRLGVRIQSIGSRTIDIAQVSAADLVEAGGEVTVRDVPGRVSVNHRGGVLTIEGVESARLNTRGSKVRLHRVNGQMILQIHGGELQASDIAGPIEVESTSAELTLDRLTGVSGPIRINAVSGRLRIAGLATDARIDGRNTAIEVALDKPVPIAIYNEGSRDTEIVQPSGGFQLDAVATDGRISLPQGLLDVTTTDNGQRSSGAVRGGGPTMTLRSSRGDIIIRPRTTPTTTD